LEEREGKKEEKEAEEEENGTVEVEEEEKFCGQMNVTYLKLMIEAFTVFIFKNIYRVGQK
jgi:hypothetical protein